MTGTLPRAEVTPLTCPTPVLFLIADTGAGHRAAAEAVIQALHRAYSGKFAPILCDPLGGPRAAWLLRRCIRLYGPMIRWAPWLWGAVYYACDSRLVMRFLRSTLLSLVNRPVADAVARERPAVIVSFHPLTGAAAVKAGKRGTLPVVTVVTDLASQHTAWWDDRVDRLVLPRAHRRHGGLGWGHPVASEFDGGPLEPRQRAAARRSLGVHQHRFLVVLTGGGEGPGGLARRAVALLRRLDDIDVVVLCGRNDRLRRRLAKLAVRFGGRLTVRGFVGNMADWLRCADVVVGKAGPSTIAEALCCAAPLVLTWHVPGQEKGNTEFVVGAGAGRYAPTARQLVREIDALRRDAAAVEAMRAASIGLSRPHAAARVAALVAELAGATEAGTRRREWFK